MTLQPASPKNAAAPTPKMLSQSGRQHPGAPARKELIMNGTVIAALPIAAMFGFAGYRVGTGRGRPVLGYGG